MDNELTKYERAQRVCAEYRWLCRWLSRAGAIERIAEGMQIDEDDVHVFLAWSEVDWRRVPCVEDKYQD